MILECFGCKMMQALEYLWNALVPALGCFIYSKLQAWLTDDPMQQPTFGRHRCWRSIGFETLEALQDQAGTESSPRISKQHLMVCLNILNMVVYGCVPLCQVFVIPSPKESTSFAWQSTSKSCSVPLTRTGVGLWDGCIRCEAKPQSTAAALPPYPKICLQRSGGRNPQKAC